MSTTLPEFTPTPGNATFAPGVIESPNPASAYAQATIDSSQSQLLDLSRQSTEVSLNMSQAANSAALATQDYYLRQKMALDYQATGISLNLARASATQEFLLQQTKIARDATTVAQRSAQSSAAAAAQSAYLVIGSQTAQAQADLNSQASQTAQAVVALTASPLTATPFAATQAALLMQEYSREQQAFVKQIVHPLIPIIAVLDLLLFILGIVLISRQFTPMPWPRRLRIAPGSLPPPPLTIIDGGFVEHNPWLHRKIPYEITPGNLPGLPDDNEVNVEMVNATDPTVANWIAELEHQLANEGKL